MNGRQSKRIRRLSVKVAGKDAPESVLVQGTDRVLEIKRPTRKDGKRVTIMKPRRKRSRSSRYVSKFDSGSFVYTRGSRAWTLGVLKRMFREDRTSFLQIEREAR